MCAVTMALIPVPYRLSALMHFVVRSAIRKYVPRCAVDVDPWPENFLFLLYRGPLEALHNVASLTTSSARWLSRMKEAGDRHVLVDVCSS